MTVQDLIGNYSVTGSNQDNEKATYKGTLNLSLDINNRVIAKWFINNNQVQIGDGFFKNNILVINFNYQGEDLEPFYGVAVYKCLSKDVLDGFWSEEHGDPQFLGEEQCLRINTNKSFLN